LSKRVLISVALAVAGSWCVPVHAQSPDAVVGMVMMGDGPILVIPVMLRFADLTAQQTEQVRRIIERDRTDTEGLLSHRRTQRASFETATAKTRPPQDER
jgi:hypothetical protein